jgi:hypothetical protein
MNPHTGLNWPPTVVRYHTSTTPAAFFYRRYRIMTRLELVATVVSGSFILIATIALALMLVKERLDDIAGLTTEPPVGGAHRYFGMEKNVEPPPAILPIAKSGADMTNPERQRSPR